MVVVKLFIIIIVEYARSSINSTQKYKHTSKKTTN